MAIKDQETEKMHKEFIEDALMKIFIIARIGIEEKLYTREEINQFIGTEAKEIYSDIYGMPDSIFMLLVLSELSELMEVEQDA